MKRILVLFAHPRPDRSQNNAALAEAAREVAAVTFVDLYAEYPSFEIDVDREQQRLRDHDVVVFHHPVYWYSSPSILKEWQDLVLEYGFAYGEEGTALRGKLFFNAVTCGARREVYTRDGAYQYELRELFQPFEQTARLCGMRYLAPFVLFSAGSAVEDGRLGEHADGYARLLQALAEERVNLDCAAEVHTLSDHLHECILKGGGTN